MLSHTLRASRPALQSLSRTVLSATARRTFVAPTPARRADLVKDLYLKEVAAYKVPEVKASDAEGQVQKWSKPSTPSSPEEGDLARDLNAYESQAVEVEGQEAAAPGAPVAAEQDWLEAEEDEAPASGGH